MSTTYVSRLDMDTTIELTINPLILMKTSTQTSNKETFFQEFPVIPKIQNYHIPLCMNKFNKSASTYLYQSIHRELL